MQRVTSNYVRNLRNTKQPDLVKRKMKNSGEDNHSLVLESRELDNDSDGLINNINMMNDDEKPPGKIMDNEPDHSTELKNQNNELENDLLTEETEINNVDQDDTHKVTHEISDKVLVNNESMETILHYVMFPSESLIQVKFCQWNPEFLAMNSSRVLMNLNKRMISLVT